MRKHKGKLSVLIVIAVLLALAMIFILRDKAKAPGATNSSVTTSQNSQQNKFDKTKYSINNPSSIWVIVSKSRPLSPINYAPNDLASVGNGQYMRAEAAQALTSMFADAKANGYTLIAESGFRSYDTQVSVYNNEVKSFGQAKADSESARPGHSEHQTGWAVDIASPGCYEDCFGTTKASAWVLTNAYKYGFVLRYPADKVAITGYRNEPWHFRYVGTALATEMHKENIKTLEEFFGVIPASQPY